MAFSDKLSVLFRITATKGSALADAMGVGRPYISRMKTGEKKRPSNPQTIRVISAFFAQRCNDEFQLNALREHTSDFRLNAPVSKTELEDVIFDWLTDTEKAPENPTERFLSDFEMFSRANYPTVDMTYSGKLPEAEGISLYYQNKGKRQALKDMLTYIAKLNKPCTLRLFTDEEYDWLFEDDNFTKWLNTGLHQQFLRQGVTFERIQPPFDNAEFHFASIERWIIAYMEGTIQQYYYPWARDKLHRRTLFVVPGHIALYSNSIYGQHEAMFTVLTRDPYLVDLSERDFDYIMKQCRPAMRTFTADDVERLLYEVEAIDTVEDFGLSKSARLSTHTLTTVHTERIRSLGTPLARRMADSFEHRRQANRTTLVNHKVIDIMVLPRLANVVAGKEPIPGTIHLGKDILFYTIEEYKAHLESILWYLDVYPNYWAILSDESRDGNALVHVKGANRTLLIKRTEPYAVFDITERAMTAAFCDYFMRIADERMTSGARQEVIKRLNGELRKVVVILQK